MGDQARCLSKCHPSAVRTTGTCRAGCRSGAESCASTSQGRNEKKMIKIFQYLITLDENDEMRTIDNSQIYLGIMCPSEKAFCIGVEHGMV